MTINVRDLGAGNGDPAQDTAAFQDAALIGCPVFVPEGRYLLLAGITFRNSVTGEGAGSVIVGTGGNASNSGRQLTIASDLGAARTSSGALACGLFSLTLNDASGLAVGDIVHLWLGQDPTDNGLPRLLLWNRIKAIDGNVVSFSDPLPEPVATGPHKLYKPLRIAENVEIGHLAFERDLASGNRGYNALGLQHVRNAHVHDLTFRDVGFTSVFPICSENVVIERIYTDRSTHDPQWPESGGFIAGWTNRNLTIRDVVARDIGGIAISFEGQNRNVLVEQFSLSSGQAGPFAVMCQLAGDSRGVVYRNGELWSSSPRVGIAGNWDQTENIALHGNTLKMGIGKHSGGLSYNGARAGQRRSWTIDFPLTPNMSGHAPFDPPSGWYASIRVMLSTLTGVTALGLTANGGGGAGLLPQIVPGQMVEIVGPIGFTTINPLGAGFNYCPPTHSKFFTLGTDATVPSGAVGRIEIDYFPVAA